MIERWRRVYYTPEDDVATVLRGLPDEASQSIDVEIYGLTDRAFVEQLIIAQQRGVAVRVMADRSQSAGPSEHTLLVQLVQAGVTVKIVESTRGKIDHLKLIIIDGTRGPLDDRSVVGTGSFNFSTSAQSQDNVFVLTNDPGEVAQAVAKFAEDWTHNEQRPAWQIPTPSTPAERT